MYPWLMAVTMWSIVLVAFSGAGVRDRLGKVKGTDFLQFYVGGALVREGRADLLYDFSAQHGRMQSVAGGASDIVYVPIQSPQTALAFSPLAGYPYTVAFGLWVIVSGLAYGLACWMSWRRADGLRRYPVETLGCCAAFPALYATIVHGQTSAISVLIVAVALLALQRDRRGLAGLAFGCLAFKPHWVAAAGAIFVLARDWRVVAGITLSALCQLGATWVVMGPDVVTAYWLMLQSLPQIGDLLEPRPGHTFRGLFAALVPSSRAALALYAIAVVITLIATARLWRRQTSVELRCSAIVLAMILISPHAFEYDLILLAPVYFMLANWICTSPAAPGARPVSRLLLVLFVAPVLAILPAPLRLQFSVTAMAAILFFICREGDGDRVCADRVTLPLAHVHTRS